MFVYILYLTGYQSAQFVRRVLHYASDSRKFLRQCGQTSWGIVIHRQTVSMYYNLSCSRLEWRFGFKFLQAEKCNASEVYWLICDVYKEVLSYIYILKRSSTPKSFDSRCNLCLEEKIHILLFPGPKKLLNKRNELIARCRHRAKFKL